MHDLGVTVVLAEHRLERVLPYADRVVYLAGDGTVTAGDPAAVLARSGVAPPVVELGRLAGWEPLPLSVRDARRRAPALRARLPDPPARAAPRGPRPAGRRPALDRPRHRGPVRRAGRGAGGRAWPCGPVR